MNHEGRSIHLTLLSALAFCSLPPGCAEDGGGGNNVPQSRQEACELDCERMQECYPDEVTDEQVATCQENCDPEVYIENCQVECADEYDDGSAELEACDDECVYDMYETGEEYCQGWCTEGGGDCDYCDEIFTDECQAAHLDYDICELAIDCGDEDNEDLCVDEQNAVVDACGGSF